MSGALVTEDVLHREAGAGRRPRQFGVGREPQLVRGHQLLTRGREEVVNLETHPVALDPDDLIPHLDVPGRSVIDLPAGCLRRTCGPRLGTGVAAFEHHAATFLEPVLRLSRA